MAVIALMQVIQNGSGGGRLMTHCHNPYHAETGMMINLGYLA